MFAFLRAIPVIVVEPELELVSPSYLFLVTSTVTLL